MRKRIDPAQAKAKRQKKILIVGVVLLAGVLAFQLPKLMKKDSQPAAATTTTTPAEVGTTTVPSGGESLASAATSVNSAALPDEPDPAPEPQQGQLVSFSLFRSKDPFVPQLSATPPGGGGETGPPPASTTPKTTPPAATPPEATPPESTPPTTETPTTETPTTETPTTEPPPAEPPSETKPPVAAPTSATISVNGISEIVKIGAAFPKANPLFRLASIKNGVAKITIAGGSLQDGSPFVPLKKDEPLTLMNTADGTKYVIKLLSVS